MNWYPIAATPEPANVGHTVVICCVDAEAAWLMPGPVNWCSRRRTWVDEGTEEVVDLRADTAYYWCHEEDVVSDALGRAVAIPNVAASPASVVAEAVETLRSVMRWEATRMGAVSAGAMRDVIAALEANKV